MVQWKEFRGSAPIAKIFRARNGKGVFFPLFTRLARSEHSRGSYTTVPTQSARSDIEKRRMAVVCIVIPLLCLGLGAFTANLKTGISLCSQKMWPPFFFRQTSTLSDVVHSDKLSWFFHSKTKVYYPVRLEKDFFPWDDWLKRGWYSASFFWMDLWYKRICLS